MGERTMENDLLRIADEILSYLGRESEATSWDIKLKFHLSSSHLYMALGILLARGSIEINPRDLTYAIKMKSAPQ